MKKKGKEKMERGWYIRTGEGVRVKRGTNMTDSNVQQRIYRVYYILYMYRGNVIIIIIEIQKKREKSILYIW
jgi:hypothetical protein